MGVRACKAEAEMRGTDNERLAGSFAECWVSHSTYMLSLSLCRGVMILIQNQPPLAPY